MKKIIFTLITLTSLISCSRDPSVNDLRSPCASLEGGIYDTACVKRLPLENNISSYTIAV